MSSSLCPEIPNCGFSFENCTRNAIIKSKGFCIPQARKTGTTIAGIIYKDGVILGADTRATEGPKIADKNCSKIHYLAYNIYCCGAGVAADTEKTTKLIASQLELHRLETKRVVRVCAANQLLKQYLFRYHGNIGAALIVGGVDSTGAHLYSISPGGSSSKLPYTTMGSGTLAAMGVFEARWKSDLSEEEGKKLVRDAIAAGIFNDLGSGSNVDLCVIRQGSTEFLRTYDEANEKGERENVYLYPPGTTATLSTETTNINVDNVVVEYSNLLG